MNVSASLLSPAVLPSLSFSSSGPDEATKATVQKLPMLTVKAGPRDGDDWIARMKEEYMALIQVRARRRVRAAACRKY